MLHIPNASPLYAAKRFASKPPGRQGNVYRTSSLAAAQEQRTQSPKVCAAAFIQTLQMKTGFYLSSENQMGFEGIGVPYRAELLPRHCQYCTVHRNPHEPQ